MKILYDSQCFDMQKFGGVSRYFYTLAKFNQGLYDYEVSGKFGDNIYLPEISALAPFPIKCNFKGKGRIIKNVNNFFTIFKANKQDYDVYHPTYYDIPKYPKNKPLVVTFHDFIHEIFPESFSKNDNTSDCKKIAVQRASRIIAISQSTKNDLLKFYPEISEDKIEVVLHAIEWLPRKKKPLAKPLAKPYILYTGARKGYKNFEAFARAGAPTLISNDLFLVCAGSPFSASEKGMLSKLGISDRVFQFFANDDELRSLYENALLFVFPSLYEGFGLPILEAFVSNCPVLLSRASCFPEIAKDAALYFEPSDYYDMSKKIAQMVQSETFRDGLIQKGRERFKEFTLPKMIESTARVYQKAVDSF